MRLARICSSALMLALAAGCCGCDSESGPPTRSALLITLDTTRADALGVYRGIGDVTPVLDRLAAEGIVYERARTVAPITLPAHASMLTGLYPPRHTARDNSLRPIPQEAVTVAERAAAQGLETAAFVAAVVLDASFGLDQGFGTYSAPVVPREKARGRIGLYEERAGSEVAAEAVAWLRSLDRGDSFFLWVHLFDPHAPYKPPAAALARADGNPYLGEVAAADDAVGTLVATLRELGRYDETFVAVVGDHGEGLGEHGEPTHGLYCYDATLRVPFIVRHADGHRAGERSAGLVSVVDVYPTLIEALGLGLPGDVDGSSLYRARVPEGRGVYFESFYGTIHHGWAPLVGWADAAGKYVHGRPPEFFDVAADPYELAPLAQDGAPDGTPYRAAIAEVLARDALRAEGLVAANMLEQLEALGYATAGSRAGLELPDPLEQSDLPNPRDRQAEAEQVRLAVRALQQGRLDEAISLFQTVVADNPRNLEAVEFLAPALIQAERCNEAIPLLEDLLETGVVRALTHVNLGRCLEAVGLLEDALAQYRRANALEAGNAVVLRALSDLLVKLGRADESE